MNLIALRQELAKHPAFSAEWHRINDLIIRSYPRHSPKTLSLVKKA